MDSTAVPDAKVALFRPEFRKIDVINSESFNASLLSHLKEGVRLVLDLSNVQFIDSSGLGKIIFALRSFRERGGDLRICSVQPPVMVLFAMVRLREIVGIDNTAEESTAALRGGVAAGTSSPGPGGAS
ncbi:MAG: STAS domain-containing protein [Spirochaetota bacterium]